MSVESLERINAKTLHNSDLKPELLIEEFKVINPKQLIKEVSVVPEFWERYQNAKVYVLND